MRDINYYDVVDVVKEMVVEANCVLQNDIRSALQSSLEKEESALGKSILKNCILNADIAEKEMRPICQDTGLAVFFIKIGTGVRIVAGPSPVINDAVNEGVRIGYKEGYLRKSVLTDPVFKRENTGDNIPAIIHLELVDNDIIEIIFAPKGGGAENMSRLKMLPPSAGRKGIVDFVVETVIEAGGNPCPPTVVGIGIGGTFEKCAYLAKKALLRPIGSIHHDCEYAELEKDIFTKINNSGVGPQGLGGTVTSFAVHIEWAPCHLASLPVAVNLNCHAHRHIKREL